MSHPSISTPFIIEALPRQPSLADLDQLTGLHLDAVASGASVSFMADSTFAEVRSFWERLLASHGPNGATLVSRDAGGIAGTVTMQPAWAPNQPHRCEIAKLLVHRRARQKGLGAALMNAAEARAFAAGYTLLTLDTVPGDPGYRLYHRLGWQECGRIPNFALYPDGTPCDTILFFKSAP